MTHEEMAELKEAIADTMRNHIGPHCIANDQHYKDHEFVCSFRESAERAQTVACKTMTSTLVVAIFGFVIWAFRHWIADVFGGGK
jgi:uncharacterized protein CbrC (UPF0167 family)